MRKSLNQRRRNSSGFTLIELLVVVAIIAVIVALTLPAIQAAREAARMTQCRNNIKQIVLALHNHHDTYRKFPKGVDARTGWAWSAFILPFIEQEALYRQFELTVRMDKQSSGIPQQQVVAVFRCPSDDTPAKHVGSHDVHDSATGVDRATTSYCGVASGTAVRDRDSANDSEKFSHIGHHKQNGILIQEGAVKIADIRDGTSNTIAIAEVISVLDEEPNRKRRDYGADRPLNIVDHLCFAGDVADGERNNTGHKGEVSEVVVSTGVGPGLPLLADNRISIDERELSSCSYHAAGQHCGLADGSVRMIAQTVDISVWNGLGTRAGKEVPGEF